MIKFACSKCRQSIRVDDKYAGKKGKCPKCGQPVVVPERSAVIVFDCEGCGHRIKVPDRYAGKRGKCPECKSPVVVPAADIARTAGHAQTVNMVMLGALVGTTGIVDTETAVKTIRCVIEEGGDVNVEAFWKGYEFIKGQDYV